MYLCKRRLGFALAIAVMIPAALLATPMMINMQGQLTDDAGNPVADGNYLIEFRLFDAESGGTQRWSTGGSVEVIVEGGLFNYLLGSDTPLPFYLADFDSLWLEAVGGSSTVGGGYENFAAATATAVGGRSGTAYGKYCGIASGYSNYAGGLSDSAAFVGGGYDNAALGSFAVVAGGQSNNADGLRGTIGGGLENIASGMLSTISGGHANVTSGSDAVVCGGAGNTVAGHTAVIVGGDNSEITAAAHHSLTSGIQMYVNNPFRVAFFDALNPGRLGLNRDDYNGGINYPIHVGTSTYNGNGAYLTEGGVWTNASSRTFKEDFRPLEHNDLLAAIAGMPIESWRYKDTDERHIGPVAEDFVAAFDVGAVREDGTGENEYLSTADVAGVALLGVKELISEDQELKQVIGGLRRK